MSEEKVTEKKITWGYELKLSTKDLVTAVVLGVAASVIVYFIVIHSSLVCIWPWGEVVGWTVTSGFYLTVFVIAAYIQKRAIVGILAMAVQFVGRLMIGGGFDPAFFALGHFLDSFPFGSAFHRMQRQMELCACLSGGSNCLEYDQSIPLCVLPSSARTMDNGPFHCPANKWRH